jgi:hypothetical protein
MLTSKSLQVIYQSDPSNREQVYWLYLEEAKALEAEGISVSTVADTYSAKLLYRGGWNSVKNLYDKDIRYINQYKHLEECNRMSCYLPLISDLSIETFFVSDLNDDVELLIKNKGWDKAFIKKDIKSLEHIEDGKSFWPSTNFHDMKKLYNEMQIDGKYAIRKFIEKDIMQQEERYWILNGNIYHRNNLIPNIVKEAAKRLNKIGSKYYTIDATPNFIVEVNPGESSDRHAVNSAELFASWIKKEFA